MGIDLMPFSALRRLVFFFGLLVFLPEFLQRCVHFFFIDESGTWMTSRDVIDVIKAD